MHKTSGRWKYGLLLSTITVLMWGILPVALKANLAVMDAYSITWYRFLAATIILGAWLAARGKLPRPRQLRAAGPLLLITTVIGLAGNYLLYLLGLNHVTPGTAQVVIQLAPMFLLLGALFLFGEAFQAMQWAGLSVLVAGLLLFFNDRLPQLLATGGELFAGVLLVFLASVSWAAYALAQKALLRSLSSEVIMFCIYLASSLIFLPTARLHSLLELDGAGLALLAFCSINTLIAYGCFAEALAHWEASRVSAVLAVTPLLTLGFMALIAALAPGTVGPERLDPLTLTGAVLVVGGSALTALARNRPAGAVP